MHISRRLVRAFNLAETKKMLAFSLPALVVVLLLMVMVVSTAFADVAVLPLCELSTDAEGQHAPPTDIRQFKQLDLDAA